MKRHTITVLKSYDSEWEMVASGLTDKEFNKKFFQTCQQMYAGKYVAISCKNY